MKHLALLVLILFFSFGPAAVQTIRFDSFMPENDMWIGVDDKAVANDMTEERFNKIIDGVAEVYAPIVKARGAKLVMLKNWADGTVNAYAQQKGNIWQVAMFGGLARHSLVTDDGFAMVVCHELGHHLGGVPKYDDLSWASDEGQSDYWASLKCYRKVIEKQNSIEIVKSINVDPIVSEQCSNQYRRAITVAACERIAMGGYSLAQTLGSFRGDEVSFSTPDTSTVTETSHPHPDAQCRLDTYFAGVLCKVSQDVDVSNTDEKVGTCNEGGYLKGERPACWFKAL